MSMLAAARLWPPLLALVAGAAACPPPGTPPPGESERRAFTTRLAQGIVVPQLQAFATQSEALRVAAQAWSATAGAGANEREAARQAWRDAMRTWQRLEVVQLGPAGSPTAFVGGQGLREGIYSWPQVNPCGVDQQLVLNEFTQPGWAAARLPNVLGLAALEYVLFVEGPDNVCPGAASINRDGTWQALSFEQVVARRAGYAAVVAGDVAARAALLRDAWTGGFAEALSKAGEPGSPFATAQQAVDEVYAALFFVELRTKDRKIAVPAGIHVDCTAAAGVCPELAESPLSLTSRENIEENLRGARMVITGIGVDGQEGPGFDDLLAQRDQTAAATAMIEDLDAAIAAAAGFGATLEEAVVSDPGSVEALYLSVKAFTDHLKGTLPSLLGLRVPDEGAGDND
jgi:uncharacterized protein